MVAPVLVVIVLPGPRLSPAALFLAMLPAVVVACLCAYLPPAPGASLESASPAPRDSHATPPRV